MNLRQILLTICLTASLGLTGCSLAAPARVPTAPTLAATATTISPTVMPLPTLPQGRQPRAIETPVTINITTTREPVRAERIVLVFQWRGGIAGRNDMWTIYQNGLVSSNKGTDQHIDPQIVQTLLTQLESLGYYSLDESYPAPCADCFEYRLLAYREKGGQTQKKAVVATDNGKLPAALTQIVAAIREVVAPTI